MIMSPEKPSDSPTGGGISDEEGFIAEFPDHMTGQDTDSPFESDDENSLNRVNGYQLLPQDPDSESVNENPNDMDSATLDAEEPHHPVVMALFRNALDESSAAILDDVSSEPTSVQAMDQDHIEKIKEAMANFTLPPSAIPDWASVVPEEQWKSWLVDRIRGKPPDVNAS